MTDIPASISQVQGNLVKKLSEEGWKILEHSDTHVLGAPIIMKKEENGKPSYVIITPNGQESEPTPQQLREW